MSGRSWTVAQVPEFVDLYALLKVPSDADEDAIKTAYRRLAKQHHTDTQGGGDVARFRAVTEARDVLCDPETRKAYDEQWRARFAPRPPRTATPASGRFATGGFVHGGRFAAHAPGGRAAARAEPSVPPGALPLYLVLARKLRWLQLAIGAALGLLWYVTRTTGFSAAVFDGAHRELVPRLIATHLGHFSFFGALLCILCGAVGELYLGIALRIWIRTPAPVRVAAAAAAVAIVLVGEYLATKPGVVACGLVVGGSALVALGISVARYGRNWRQDL